MYVDSRILVVLPIGECTTDGMDEYKAARKEYFVEIERLKQERSSEVTPTGKKLKTTKPHVDAGPTTHKRTKGEEGKTTMKQTSTQLSNVLPGNNFWHQEAVDGKKLGHFQPTSQIHRKTPSGHEPLRPNHVFSCYDPSDSPLQVQIVKVGVWSSGQRVVILRRRSMVFDVPSMQWEPSTAWQPGALELVDASQVSLSAQTLTKILVSYTHRFPRGFDYPLPHPPQVQTRPFSDS